VQRTRAASAGVLAAALLALALAQCRRAELPADARPPPAPIARALPEPPAAPPPTVAEADAAALPASRGTWLDATIYRFRLDDVRSCSPPATDGASRIGAVVRVTSNIDGLLVAPRDVKLESGGVILDSVIAPKAAAGCAPPLAPRSLRAGKTAEGVVVFDVPPGFNIEHRPVRITYQPTRWGGARRVEAVVAPDALTPSRPVAGADR